MAMLFPGAFWLLGSRFAFLGMGGLFPGTPALVPLAPGKGPSFLGTLKWFLGIVSVAGLPLDNPSRRFVSSSSAAPTAPKSLQS